jgi:hypothetical protein
LLKSGSSIRGISNIVALTVLVLSQCVCNGSSSCDSGKKWCKTSTVSPPERITDLLHYTNTFVIGTFGETHQTDSGELGWASTSNSNCVDCYDSTSISDTTYQVFAASGLRGDLGQVVALCRSCYDFTHTETVCDGGPPPSRDADISDYCHEVEVSGNTCRLPEWHYHIPRSGSGSFAVFLWKDPRPGYSISTMSMRFEVVDDTVDLSILEGGQKVALDEIEQYLLKDVVDGNPRFFP